MPDFEEQASIHPKTVTEFSQGDIVGPKREHVRSSRSVADNTYVKVHPEVWRRAIEISDGEPWRIEILSETEVRVHNNGDWKKGRPTWASLFGMAPNMTLKQLTGREE